MPIEILQVVGCQDVDIATTTDPGVVYDALRVSTLQQAFQSLQPVTRLGQVRAEGGGGGGGCDQDGCNEFLLCGVNWHVNLRLYKHLGADSVWCL